MVVLRGRTKPESFWEPSEPPTSFAEYLANRPEWMERAACRNVDTSVFFPVATADAREARQICSGCTVRLTCLDWALERGPDTKGIWGASASWERNEIRQGRMTIDQLGRTKQPRRVEKPKAEKSKVTPIRSPAAEAAARKRQWRPKQPRKICSIPDCQHPAKAREMCRGHYTIWLAERRESPGFAG